MKKIAIFFADILFLISVVSIFMQTINNSFSTFISPSIVFATLIYFSCAKKNVVAIRFFIFGLIILFINFSFGIFKGNDFSIATRFLIMLLVLLISVISTPSNRIINIFIVCSLIFSFILIYKEFYYIIHPGLWITDRTVWQQLQIGDVYTYNNWFYRIQVRGTSLLPVAFFITVVSKFRFRILELMVIGSGVIIAGNFMYIVSSLVFIFIWYFIYNKPTRLLKIVTYISSVPAVGIILMYIKNTLELKGASSLPVRFEQAYFLLGDVFDTNLSAFFGQGLGNVLVSAFGQYRNYNNITYFELQSLYIFNQLGILFTSGYLIIMYKLIRLSWRSKVQYILLFCYLIYAVSNPYIFDATNIIVFLIISTVKVTFSLNKGVNNV